MREASQPERDEKKINQINDVSQRLHQTEDFLNRRRRAERSNISSNSSPSLTIHSIATRPVPSPPAQYDEH